MTYVYFFGRQMRECCNEKKRALIEGPFACQRATRLIEILAYRQTKGTRLVRVA